MLLKTIYVLATISAWEHVKFRHSKPIACTQTKLRWSTLLQCYTDKTVARVKYDTIVGLTWSNPLTKHAASFVSYVGLLPNSITESVFVYQNLKKKLIEQKKSLERNTKIDESTDQIQDLSWEHKKTFLLLNLTKHQKRANASPYIWDRYIQLLIFENIISFEWYFRENEVLVH